MIPEEEALRPVECPGSGTGDWQKADIERAIAAAKEAGLTAYRIEIAPDGTISIIVGSNS